MNEPRYSIVIPVYKNELSVTPLLESLEQNLSKLLGKAEVIFVDDGSPDDSVGKILTFKDVCCFQIRFVEEVIYYFGD
jgi:glycosyltransferase involved in cell wall biosynthesis